MLSTTKFFISACLIFIASITHGQEKKKVAKPKKDYAPSGFRVGTDLIDLGKTIAGNTFSGWEVNGDVDFANYFLAVDVGSWAKDIVIPNGNYSNSGNYYRAGIDVNFLGNDPEKNMFFMGFRYGHSVFNESVTYLNAPPHFFSPATTTSTNPNASGGWGELTTGLRVKIWKGLWLGYTARLKFAPHVKSSPNFVSYDMPGYGAVQDSPWWGFNYQVFWRFAWKKKIILPEKK